MAAENAEYVIITNEDPYDDDPMMIIDNVATGAEANGKILNQNLLIGTLKVLMRDFSKVLT